MSPRPMHFHLIRPMVHVHNVKDLGTVLSNRHSESVMPDKSISIADGGIVPLGSS
jgi:hypothetical protein